MSKYKEVQTAFVVWSLLVEALKQCGKPVEFATDAELPLFGYHGDQRAETAKAVIRRAHIESSANDLGFAFDPATGTYVAIISEYDSGSTDRPAYQILERVKQEYATALAVQTAEAQGYRVEQTRENGVTRLRCVMA